MNAIVGGLGVASVQDLSIDFRGVDGQMDEYINKRHKRIYEVFKADNCKSIVFNILNYTDKLLHFCNKQK